MQIEDAAKRAAGSDAWARISFVRGAMWADKNPNRALKIATIDDLCAAMREVIREECRNAIISLRYPSDL